LVKATESSARCVNGFTGCTEGKKSNASAPAADPRAMEFYIEQSGVTAYALQEALVQDYDGLIRIAPAVPSGWDFDGSVYVRGKTKVDVQVHDGIPSTVVIECGIAQPLKIRNPWPNQPVDVVAGKSGTKIIGRAAGSVIEFKGAARASYLIERHDSPTSRQRFAVISGTPATSAKRLGPVQLGLFSSQEQEDRPTEN
jgi:hypothetical protein